MKRLSMVLVLAASACGGKSKPAEPVAQEQTLAQALVQICEAPNRAEGSPEWGQKSVDERAAVLGKHMQEGVTNARAKAWLDTEAPKQQTELSALLQESSITECRLQEVWTAAATP